MSNHYDASYAYYQQIKLGGGGNFSAWANSDKFKDYVNPEFNMIDFGCGSGTLLALLPARNKIGVDINIDTIKTLQQKRITGVKYTREIEDNWADLIISNHALEHVPNPLAELEELYKKLKTGGKIVFFVPSETYKKKFKEKEPDHHLYSWGCQSLGNIFKEAGFKVIESKPYLHKWPPRYQGIAAYFGRRVFNMCCRVWARYKTDWSQIMIVAEK